MESLFGNLNILEIGFFLLGIGYLFTQWKNGSQQATKDVILIYQTQLKQLKEQYKESSEQIHKLTSEIGELRGILKEKDERIKTLEAVDLSKNKQLNEYMNNSNILMEQILKYVAPEDVKIV